MRVSILVFLTIGVVKITLSQGAEAYMYCHRPDEPRCIGSFGTFDSEWSFNSCKRDLERYLSEVNNYIDCVRADVEIINNEASGAVDKFNCRARGGLYC